MSTVILDSTFDKTTTHTPALHSRSSTSHLAVAKLPRRGKWQTAAWLTSAVAIVGLSAAFEPWKSSSSHAVQAATHSADTLKTVSIDRPARASTANVILPATIRPWQTTTLHARVSGYLGAWHRDLGTSVKAGELLATIETPELDQELAEAKSLVREADAAVLQAKAERVEAEADLKVAESQLVRVQAQVKLTQLQVSRRETLLVTRAVPREEYDLYATQLETQTAEIAAAKSDIDRRHSNLETRSAIIEAKEAAVISRQANVDRLQELQTFKRITAPFDGIVTQRSAEVGMLVTAGKESLFTLEDMSRVRVQVNVPQAYSTQVTAGVAAIVNVPESTMKAVQGTVTRVAESVNSSNRMMLAEIELQNANHRYQPGSYAHVTLTTSKNEYSWTIPTNTLSMRVEGTHVALVNAQNQIEIKPVTLGRDLGNRVVVVDGIQGNERLVVNPSDDLTNGTTIQVRGSDEVGKVAVR